MIPFGACCFVVRAGWRPVFPIVVNTFETANDACVSVTVTSIRVKQQMPDEEEKNRDDGVLKSDAPIPRSFGGLDVGSRSVVLGGIHDVVLAA